MKIRPVILCGGSGSRLWPQSKNNPAKQFIDFGGWSLLEKTLIRIKNPIFDYPIISTNFKYLKLVRIYLNRYKIKNYRIILEPVKQNTGPAMLSSALIRDIPNLQPIIFFPSDHLIDNVGKFNKAINKNKKKLDNINIFVFGIKPTFLSTDYGYFISKKKDNINRVTKFIEKPIKSKAKQVIKKKGYWNSGMIFIRKDSVIKNFKKFQPKIYNNCFNAVKKAKINNKTYYLNKSSFVKLVPKSFDYAILEKSKQINAINLNIPWSDFGSWEEISKFYLKNKSKYLKKKNIFYRPWGKYINLFYGKGFLVKELTLNSKSSISLQKHNYRAEHWLITKGKPKITINKNIFFKKKNESVFIPTGTVHRIENYYKKPVKIIEVQTGSILRESDIVRYQDVYNRIK